MNNDEKIMFDFDKLTTDEKLWFANKLKHSTKNVPLQAHLQEHAKLKEGFKK